MCGRECSLLRGRQQTLQARGRAAELILTTDDVDLGGEEIAWVVRVVNHVLVMIPVVLQDIFLTALHGLNDVRIRRHTNMGRLLRIPPHCLWRSLPLIVHLNPILETSAYLCSSLRVELRSVWRL